MMLSSQTIVLSIFIFQQLLFSIIFFQSRLSVSITNPFFRRIEIKTKLHVIVSFFPQNHGYLNENAEREREAFRRNTLVWCVRFRTIFFYFQLFLFDFHFCFCVQEEFCVVLYAESNDAFELRTGKKQLAFAVMCVVFIKYESLTHPPLFKCKTFAKLAVAEAAPATAITTSCFATEMSWLWLENYFSIFIEKLHFRTHTHNIYTEREREQEQEFYQRLKGVASAQQGIASGSFEMRWMSSTCFDWEKTKTTTIKKMLNSILYVLMLKSVRHFNSCLFLKFSFAHLCFSSIHWCWNNSSMNKRDWIAVCHFDKIPMGRIKKWK